jgi:pyridoxal phosphate enzyme (YggS family)
VRERIELAARAAGRAPAEITLIAVSKTWPAADIVALRELGQLEFAENREQEARLKVPEVAALTGAAGHAAAGPGVRWHFVGQLQRNKARAVVGWADWLHTVDRPHLVPVLARAALGTGRSVSVCVQVSLDDPAAAASRGGAPPAEVPALADAVAAAGGLRLAGVMAVAPRGQPARSAFARLRTVAESIRADHPGAAVISAGMSGDLDDAVAEGATHLRIGTALFGHRGAVP